MQTASAPRCRIFGFRQDTAPGNSIDEPGRRLFLDRAGGAGVAAVELDEDSERGFSGPDGQ